MTAPPVSIVVPTRGRAALVERLLACLADVSAAYPGPSEVLVCDSSGEPDAGRIATAAASTGARVVRSSPGIARQRNAALRSACSPLVWFVDSDCRPTAGALPALVSALEPGVAAAAGAVELRGPPSVALDAARSTGVVAAFDGFGAPAGARLPWAVTANLLVRRDVVLAAGGFDERFPTGEDVDLGLRLTRSGDICWVPQAVVHHDTATWSRPGDVLGRFLRYGSGDAELLGRHPHLRGPVEPSIVNAAPLALAVAVLAGRGPLRPAAALLAWAAGALASAAALRRPTTPRALVQAGLATILGECLHLGRQVRAVRNRAWPVVWSGVVLDDGQRRRERADRRRRAVALAVAAPVLLLGGRR